MSDEVAVMSAAVGGDAGAAGAALVAEASWAAWADAQDGMAAVGCAADAEDVAPVLRDQQPERHRSGGAEPFSPGGVRLMDAEMQRLVALEHEPRVGGIAREHRIEPVGELLVVRCREDSGERGASGQVPIQARTDALNLVARTLAGWDWRS